MQKHFRPYYWGERAVRQARLTMAATPEHSESSHRWPIAAASGALASMAVAYSAIISLETAITEHSPGAFVQAIGDLAMMDAFLGATKESFVINHEIREAQQWHELSTEEKRAA